MNLAARLLSGTALLAAFLVAARPSEAAGPLEYDIANGRFFTEAVESGLSGRGFSITDDGGVLFWSEYQRLGGVGTLGYPISRRFVLDGLPSQATQRGILQWQGVSGQARLVNLLDYLSTRQGADDRLASKGVPRAAQLQAGQPWDQALQTRLPWLDSNPAIKAYYYQGGQDAAIFLYGLPSSPAVDQGDFVAMRFQRSALLQWKKDVPWAKAGDVTVANAGDLSKELGVIPKVALEAEAAPAPASPPAAATPTATPTPQPTALPSATPVPTREPMADPSSRVSGLATWYGEPYHGRRTASGEVFDMNDPTTAAANIFPLGTWLKVTRTETGVSVIVRVNDTGGFRAPFIVDLSWAAFQKLTGGGSGSVAVTVEVVPGPGG
ncbi:MAG: septal ring lytic transglycosylase RlpA family protein [Bacteroidetes bacterium]|nr:septal ring lytic transglycosylase RlpA family protein [Bacteroidota bacterium]